MVTADGMPLVWLQHAAGQRKAGRVYGPDLFLALCEQTAVTTCVTISSAARRALPKS
ncbi:MAG: hypothetical protein U0521_16300 [Anaerolineae bacterium]